MGGVGAAELLIEVNRRLSCRCQCQFENMARARMRHRWHQVAVGGCGAVRGRQRHTRDNYPSPLLGIQAATRPLTH